MKKLLPTMHVASIIGGEGVIANNAPDDNAVSQCEDLGRQLAQA